MNARKAEWVLAVKACYNECHSLRKTAKKMHVTKGTVSKYVKNDVAEVCKYHKSEERVAVYGIDLYAKEIFDMLHDGATIKSIHRAMVDRHQYAGSYQIFSYHLRKLKAARCNQGAENAENTFIRSPDNQEPQILKRSGVFNYIWRGIEMTQEHRNYVFTKFPQVAEVANCVKEWRSIFDEQSIPRLVLFIERYSKCSLPSIASFARGLTRDIDAIEHAVSSYLSNAYVEGANNKVKVVKRVMYGRCGKPLLAAKILLPHYIQKWVNE